MKDIVAPGNEKQAEAYQLIMSLLQNEGLAGPPTPDPHGVGTSAFIEQIAKYEGKQSKREIEDNMLAILDRMAAAGYVEVVWRVDCGFLPMPCWRLKPGQPR